MKMPSHLQKLLRATLPLTPKIQTPIPSADYVFITQYYKNGGAERVINNYISTLKQLHPSLSVVILATDDDSGATWTAGIPSSAKFINLSPLSKSLPRYLRTRLLAKVLSQLSPKTLHIVNSKVAMDYVAGQKNPPRTYLSLFNSDLSPSGRPRTYYKELKSAAPHLAKVFTDNAAVIAEAAAATRLPRTLFKVHYQPISLKIHPPHPLPSTGPLRILWASRLAPQKRPDILKDIAGSLSPNTFKISAYGTPEPPYSKDYFADTKAINYRGPYTSFASLPTEDFDLFLYTSQADGLPNTLLEAAAAGLPILAPATGGISEFISGGTGFLIPDFRDTAAYISTLTTLAQTRPDLKAKITAAQSLLRTRHSRENFANTVKSDIIVK